MYVMSDCKFHIKTPFSSYAQPRRKFIPTTYLFMDQIDKIHIEVYFLLVHSHKDPKTLAISTTN